MYQLPRHRKRLALGFFVVGASIVGAAVTSRSIPPGRTWLPFALAFFVLEWRSVEVNDRMFMSSSIMVALTAGVVFALTGESATLGIPLVAACGTFQPADFSQRRWFQPMVNFGQLVVSAAAAGAVLDLTIGASASRPSDLPRIALAGGLAALVYMVVNTLQVRFIVRLAYARREITPWSHLTMLFGSQAVMGFIGALLGATLLLVEPGAIPLVAMVFVIGHMSFASYSALREAHLATLRGMVKSLEAKDVYTRGHTERVARFVQMIAEELGFSGTRIERLRWAALIHDVGKLAVPKALIGKKGRLSDEETAEMRRHAHIVEEILAEVEFLQPMVEIASGHHSHFDGNGYGGRGHRHGQTPELDTCILSVADAFDAMTSSRSYRVALSQRFALRELSENSGTQFHPYVVDAFERALKKAGEEWGSSRVDDEEAARRLAEQREEFPLLYG